MNLLDALRSTIGAGHVLSTADAMAPYLTDWRRRYHGKALAVVRPSRTDEVASLVRACAQARTPIVPQGGNTGLVGGATPDDSGRAIVLSMQRMNRIRQIDTINGSLTAEAGCILQAVQQAARDAGRLFPLSLAAEGTATIGGNLSTNAGGTQVLRYGNARELTLGLEVVLPSGEVLDSLRGLRKDNTGYDLRNLFIGAEGTLGVITAACLKTFALPAAQAVALLAVRSLDDAMRVLALAQATVGPALTAFEFLSDLCLALVERHFPQTRSPFAARHPFYLLIEISDHHDDAHATALLQSLAERALGDDLIADAALAQSEAQRRSLWQLREFISEAQAAEGPNIKHDIAVPISAISRFVKETDALLLRHFGAVRMVTFGHLGDGNLHYNVSAPLEVANDDFLALQPAIYRCVHDQVARFDGSISAEHGIGQLKRDELMRYKSGTELALMKKIKGLLDPDGIMNPGKVI